MKHLPEEGLKLANILCDDDLLTRNEMWWLRGGDGEEDPTRDSIGDNTPPSGGWG